MITTRAIQPGSQVVNVSNVPGAGWAQLRSGSAGQSVSAGQMTAEQWAATERAAIEAGLGDAELSALAIGCPVHGNRYMDWDTGSGVDEVFCTRGH